MITKEQVLQLSIGTVIWYRPDSRPAVEYRINGKVKTWKRDLQRFEVSLRRGWKEWGQLNNYNRSAFYLTKEDAMTHEERAALDNLQKVRRDYFIDYGFAICDKLQKVLTDVVVEVTGVEQSYQHYSYHGWLLFDGKRQYHLRLCFLPSGRYSLLLDKYRHTAVPSLSQTGEPYHYYDHLHGWSGIKDPFKYLDKFIERLLKDYNDAKS